MATATSTHVDLHLQRKSAPIISQQQEKISLVRHKVANPRTEATLPAIKQQPAAGKGKRVHTKKKTVNNSAVVTTPPPSGSKKLLSSARQNKARLERSRSRIKEDQKPCSRLQIKGEKPCSPSKMENNTVEIKSEGYFYLPKRRMVDKPSSPFRLFIDETNSLAKIVWLYLLESEMPFDKIPITSKEGTNASRGVPAFCKHCIFTDGDTSIGQPTAILRYLCTNYTHNLLMGVDPSHISQSFSWIHWAASVLHRDLFYLKKGKGRSSPEEGAVETSSEGVSLYFDMLNKIFSARLFLLGDVAWFCDTAVALVLEDSGSLAAWPNLQAWLGRVKSQSNWTKVAETQ